MTDPVESAVVPPEPEPRVISVRAIALSVVAIWVGTVLLGVLILIFSAPSAYASWLSLAMGVSVIAAFAAQLALRSKQGFVNRLAVTLSGNLVIVVIFGVILWLTTL